MSTFFTTGETKAAARKSLLYYYDYNEGMGFGIYEMMKQRMVLLPSFNEALGSNASAITTYMTNKYEIAKDEEGKEWYFLSEDNKALFVHPVDFNLEKVCYPSEIMNENGKYSVYSIGGAGAYYADYKKQINSRSLNEYYDYEKCKGSYQYSSNVNYKQRSLFYAFGSFGNGKCSGYVVSEDAALNYNNFEVHHEYYNCRLKEIEIPMTVRRIEEYTFVNCVGIAKLTGGDGIIEIGNKAFSDAPFVTELKEHSVSQYSYDNDRIIDNTYYYYNGKNYLKAIGPGMNDYLKSYLAGMYNGYKPFFYFPKQLADIVSYDSVFSGRSNVKLYNAGPSRIRCPYGHVYELNDIDEGCYECDNIIQDIIVVPKRQIVDINELPSFRVSGIYQSGKVRNIDNFYNDYVLNKKGIQTVKITASGITKEVVVECSGNIVCNNCGSVFKPDNDSFYYCYLCSKNISKVIFHCEDKIIDGQRLLFRTEAIYQDGSIEDVTGSTVYSILPIGENNVLLNLNYAGFSFQKVLNIVNLAHDNGIIKELNEDLITDSDREIVLKILKEKNDESNQQNIKTASGIREIMEEKIKASMKNNSEILSYTMNELHSYNKNSIKDKESLQRVKLFLRGQSFNEGCRVYYNIWNDNAGNVFLFSGENS
ncbi:MAG: leucine-rich repeat domain-containing protein [Lachnospiraceae bacterium]|nr:leucine-rich repeat domain-containing protein [Lachnospiraceae bacterium]